MTEFVAGLLTIGVPAIVIGYIVLARTQPVLVMYLAAMAVGLGYLSFTGAVTDVGKTALDAVAAYQTNAPAATETAAPVAPANDAVSEATPAAAE